MGKENLRNVSEAYDKARTIHQNTAYFGTNIQCSKTDDLLMSDIVLCYSHTYEEQTFLNNRAGYAVTTK